MTNSKYIISEKQVSYIWENHCRFRLFNSGIHVIYILYPGRRTNECGCDFQDAVFLLDGERIVGDVEIHSEARDWFLHGHNTDEKYCRVRLHVVWSNSDKLEIADCNGTSILTLELGHYSKQLLPLLNSGKPDLETQICVHSLKFRLNERKLYETLLQLGIYRFKDKAEGISGQFRKCGSGQTLYRLVAYGLGYNRNSLLFDKLTSYITLDAIKSLTLVNYIFIQSILLGTCGFLPSQRNLSYKNEYIQGLENIWLYSGYRNLIHYYEWNISGVRPFNYPVRRVVALSYFVVNLIKDNLSEDLLEALINNGIYGVRSLINNCLNYQQEKYWAYHYDFNCRIQKKTALVGMSRIDDIIINVVLPYLYEYNNSFVKLENVNELIMDYYVMYPSLQSNYIDRYMSRLLPTYVNFRRSAVVQQGLLYLFKQYCRYKLCSVCPIASQMIGLV